MYSLRRTLAVRFSLTMLVALSLIGLWAFLGTHRTLRSELDRTLLDVALGQGLTNTSESEGPASRFVTVRNAEGTIIATNTPEAADVSLDTVTFARALSGESAWVTQRWRDSWIRAAYVPATGNSQLDAAVIQVSAFIEPFSTANRRILLLVLGTVLLGTAATAVGASWLAGSAVAPVGEITAQAESIRPGSAGKRITAHADAQEYAGLVAVLNRMLERLDRALEGQRRIIRDLGHDLRTPITAMRGELEIALRGERTPEEYQSILQSALEEIERLESIREALMLLARLESGELTPQHVPTDVDELVEGAVARAQRLGKPRVIHHARDGGDATAPVDPVLLRGLLDQLLENAILHTPPGTKVETFVSGDRDNLVITVADDGPGVAPDELPHLFERGYRVDTARSRNAGPGLGLTLAAVIAEAHQGTIGAEQGPQGGLKITLRLPRVHDSLPRFA